MSCAKFHCRKQGCGKRTCATCEAVYISCDSTRAGYCPPCASTYSREYRRRTNCDGMHQKKRRLRDKGITQEQHDEALERQGGKCAICRSPDPKWNTWCIDHDHACCPGAIACGKCFRGLLCANCNRGIGIFLDNPALLREAANYVESSLVR